MPAFSVYDPNDKDENEIGGKEIRTRAEWIGEHWQWYRGEHPRTLNKTPEGYDPNVVINLVRDATKKDSSFFIGEGPTFEASAGDAAQAALDEYLKAIRFRLLLQNIVTSGTLAGHVWLKLSIDDAGMPKIHHLDAKIWQAWWEMGDIDSPVFYRAQWERGRTAYRQDVVPDWLWNGQPRTDPQSWYIAEYEQVKMSAKWELMDEPEIWPYPFSPVVQWQNLPEPHMFYGASDFYGGAIDLTRAVEFTQADINLMQFYFAAPRIVITGATLDEGQAHDTSTGRVMTFDNPDARVTTVEPRGDMAGSMENMNTLKAAFYRHVQSVDLESAANLTPLSDYRMRVLFLSMTQKLDAKHELYEMGLVHMLQNALSIMGVETEIAVTWPDPMPQDTQAAAAWAEAMKALGLASDRTLASEMGYDYDHERSLMSEQQFDALNFMTAQQQRGLNNE
jgi:hypothetical protein